MNNSKSQASNEVLFLECFFLASISLAFFLVSFFFAEARYNDLFHGLPSPNKEANQTHQPDSHAQVSPTGTHSDKEVQTDVAEKQTESDQKSLNSSELARQKRDVTAQEGMWRAAIHLVVLTFFQICLGFVTILLVWNTFRVQREELDATKKANTLQLQPYLEITGFQVKWMGIWENMGWIDIFIDIKNIGDTNAIEISDLCVTHVGYQIVPKRPYIGFEMRVFEYFHNIDRKHLSKGKVGSYTSGTVLPVLAPKAGFHLYKHIGMVSDGELVDFSDSFVRDFNAPDTGRPDELRISDKPPHVVHFIVEFEFWFKDTITDEDRGVRGFISEGTMYSGSASGFNYKPKPGKSFMILLEDGRLATKRGEDAERAKEPA